MRMYGTLTRVKRLHEKDSPHPLRTREVFGFFDEVPVVGKVFVLIGEPMDANGADARIVQTSTVIDVERVTNSIVRFLTVNSAYELVIDKSQDRLS